MLPISLSKNNERPHNTNDDKDAENYGNAENYDDEDAENNDNADAENYDDEDVAHYDDKDADAYDDPEAGDHDDADACNDVKYDRVLLNRILIRTFFICHCCNMNMMSLSDDFPL